MVQLLEMRETVRRMTARYTEEQMTSDQIDRYINLFYTLQFPEHFKTLKLSKPLSFLTIPNVDTYAFVYENGIPSVAPISNPAVMFPAAYTTGAEPLPTVGNIQLTPPVYCQGYLLRYNQDKTNFYNRWPKLSVNQIINQGNGTLNVDYSGVIPSFPFLRAEMDIFGNVTLPGVIISAYNNRGYYFSCTDLPIIDGSGLINTGNLILGDGVTVCGSVNYITGAYNLTASLTGAIPTDAQIYASVVPYQSSRPVEMLFYNQQITLRPVPQQVYQVEIQISQQPTDLIAETNQPELDEWYLFICAGAAKLIYTDFPDPEGMQYLMPIWQEQLQISQRRTLKQYGPQRAQTIFSQQGRPLASWFYGTEYSGN